MKRTFLLLVFLSFGLDHASAQLQESEWLERGLLAEFRGNHEEALQIWTEAMEELDPPYSRIGFEFIRIATEQGLYEYYDRATVFYDRALAEPFRPVNRAAIRQEIDRLQPLAGEGIHRQWKEWFEERNPALTDDIRGFWKQMDPTPGIVVNERLLEHWERIAESRSRFTRNRTSVYDTDDRAEIFIRYGEPDRINRGTLITDQQTLGSWLTRQFDTAEPQQDHNEQNVSEPTDLNRDHSTGSMEQFEEFIFRFHTQPEYEVWTYEPLSEAAQTPLIFIFGDNPDSGLFKRLESVGDFIPGRAYLSDRRNQLQPHEFVRLGLTPALALQILYYEQLAEIDTWFGEQLNTIRGAYINQQEDMQRSPDLDLQSRSRRELQMRVAEAPREISSAVRKIPDIPVELHQYRLLDEEMNSVLVTFLESRPKSAIFRNLVRQSQQDRDHGTQQHAMDGVISADQEELEQFRLTHQLLIYDRNWDEEGLYRDRLSLVMLPDSDGEPVLQSVFRSGHTGQRFQAATASLIRHGDDSSGRYSHLFSPTLRGLGGITNQQPPPLEVVPGQLEMGDLILGFHDETLPEGYPFPFRVANDQTIPSDESLILHFEVYNLTPDPQTEFTSFELTYRIYPVLEDGTVVTGDEEFYLTIHFEDDRTRVVEDLEIRTSELRRGLYELQIFIRDLKSGEEQQRDIRFEVTDQGNIPIDS